MCSYPRRSVQPYFQWFSLEDGGWLNVKFFSPNIIIGESIGISIRELNKVHDIYAQFISDKNKNKGMTHNLL